MLDGQLLSAVLLVALFLVAALAVSAGRRAAEIEFIRGRIYARSYFVLLAIPPSLYAIIWLILPNDVTPSGGYAHLFTRTFLIVLMISALEEAIYRGFL